MTDYEPWAPSRGAEIIAGHADEGATLPILHALQEAFGYIPQAGIPMIAETLNLTRAEVHGIVRFYHEFRRHPPGRHVLRLCRAEACQALGADGWPRCAARLRCGMARHHGGWRGDAGTGVLPGLCAIGPSAHAGRRAAGPARRARIARALERRDDARVFVPRDAAALALGADAVAARWRRRATWKSVRTGSRGLFWLEPMVEVPHRRAGSPMGRCGRRHPGLLAAGCWRVVRIRCGSAGRGVAVPRKADAADIRPLRHRRSAVAG